MRPKWPPVRRKCKDDIGFGGKLTLCESRERLRASWTTPATLAFITDVGPPDCATRRLPINSAITRIANNEAGLV